MNTQRFQVTVVNHTLPYVHRESLKIMHKVFLKEEISHLFDRIDQIVLH